MWGYLWGMRIDMRKLAIIGASYLQEPLIQRAKSMGLETHVFAWAVGDIGETAADHFYPTSITEKDAILQKCRELRIGGICSIASDLAIVTVNYVAAKMGLTGNSLESTYRSTNKNAMRRCFLEHGDPSPRSCLVRDVKDLEGKQLTFPMIVKPVDRSGSRGITKLENVADLEEAIEWAKEQGFEKAALVEEFAEGQEYSVECVSWHGEHHFLALTKKYTTGAPHFIETAHLEPAPITGALLEQVKAVTFHALDSLGLKNGASHTELKIDRDGTIKLIEIGGRMGGDCIGSDLVQISTGVDFVRTVIQIALGQEPDLSGNEPGTVAAVRFICGEEDRAALSLVKREHPQYLVREYVQDGLGGVVTDSSTRAGYFLLRAQSREQLERYLPEEENE